MGRLAIGTARPDNATDTHGVRPAGNLMLIHRCPYLFVERREDVAFSLDDLLGGGSGAVTRGRWVALAAPLAEEHELDGDDLRLLEAVGCEDPVPRAELERGHAPERIDRLLAAGLLLGESVPHQRLRARARQMQAAGWWPLAAAMQAFGRWRGVDVQEHPRETIADMVAAHGPAPAETHARGDAAHRLSLPPPRKTALDDLLARRVTCRNFAADGVVPLAQLADLLHRVFGEQGRQELAPGAVALKKNSPSGGGLHPVEAYVLAQRVEGLAPGLYHYHAVAHALEPLSAGDVGPGDGAMAATDPSGLDAPDPGGWASLALRLVAGQTWFANAPVLVLMTARFDRNFWKYQRHAKAWKVVQLDAGHLSQNLYLTATEMGHGAFVTGAINDEVIEQVLGLDGVTEGPVLINGFGPRAEQIVVGELDPNGRLDA